MTLRDLHRTGFTRRQFRTRVGRGLYVPVAPDVWRHAAAPWTWDLQLRAGGLWLGDTAVVAGASAAALWQLDEFAPGPVEFALPSARRGLPWLTVHSTEQWTSRDHLRCQGFRVTSVTRTIIDLAHHGHRAHALEGAIDSGIRMRLTSLPTLRARMDELGGSGRGGIRLLRALLLDSGGESWLERQFLRLVRLHHFPRPETQVVYRRNGTTAARVDFRFGSSLVVEVSGRLGHTSDADRQRDARRRNALLQAGVRVLEFTTADVLDEPAYVVATLESDVARSVGKK